MQLFHKNNGKKSLLIFFSGWALDFNPLAHLFSNELLNEKDLLFVWDYKSTAFNFDFSQYEQIDVISFSYGVFMSQFVDIPKIHSNIAICGTLFPINREFGISPKIFDLTLKTLNDENLQKFYKNMFDEENEFEKFIQLNKTSQLNIENLKQELETIKSLAIENNKTKRKFTRVYVANNDKIIPARAQNAFWQDKINIKQLESGHFPFFKISLEDLLNE